MPGVLICGAVAVFEEVSIGGSGSACGDRWTFWIAACLLGPWHPGLSAV